MADFTPMIKQYLEIKDQNRDAFLFYRIGDFYEMFFEDAVKASKLLDLVLTGRDCGQDERAPMCGVPYHSVENYINRLVAMGFKVAVCEQMEDPALAKGLVKRDIIRRVTPGTVIDDNVLPGDRNNYICSVFSGADSTGICFADISAGIMKATCFSGEDTVKRLINEISAFQPSEIILNRAASETRELARAIDDRKIFRSVPEGMPDYDRALEMTLSQTKTASLSALGIEGCPEIVMALGALLAYAKTTAMCELSHMDRLEYYSDRQYMELSWVTRRCLELTETMLSHDRRGSLLGVLDSTRTAAGGRLMRSWVEQPLLSIAQVLRRQNAVAELVSDTVSRSEIRSAMDGVYDLERLMGSIVYGSANAKTLCALAKTAGAIPAVKTALSGAKCEELRSLDREILGLSEIRDMVERSIREDAPVTLREAGLIKPGFDAELDRLSYVASNGKKMIADMEAGEREQTGIKNLKIGYNRVFGYYIEASKQFSDQIPERYIRKQTVSNCERYFTPELKELETTILDAQDRINSLEYDLFCRVRDFIRERSGEVMSTASALARLDVLAALAETAVRRNYTRPDVDLSGELNIRGGRHPVVEALLRDSVFVPNDTLLDRGDNRLAIITGPNMAGKSTYMRQVALIVIMAQMGGFVPAESARIGLTDKIFTRVGASDELSAGKSTFMVEMTETAEILRTATRDSLIILDEIGRGTSTYDGMSIARAVLEYIASKRTLGAKTLFATHYHELTALEGQLDGVKNYNIIVKKRGDDIIFLRKIVRGGVDDSYGVEVAKLAGLPTKVISRAREILSELETGKPQTVAPDVKHDAGGQASLTDGMRAEIIDELSRTQADAMTPIEAMNILYRLSVKARESL